MFKKRNIIIIVFVILVVVFVLIAVKIKIPRIVATQPEDNSVNVSQKVDISILFDRSLNNKDTEKISFEIKPEESYEISFSENSMIVSFKQDLKSDTNYDLVIRYNNEIIHEFSFQSTPFTDEIISEEGFLQSIDDLIFSEAFKEFINDYPWYVNLPIEKDQYHIVYDFERKSFRIRILTPDLDSNQEDALLENAINDLKEIGLVEPINYYVIKE
jgi:hypothetical protein